MMMQSDANACAKSDCLCLLLLLFLTGTWSTVWGSIEPGTVSWKGSDPTEWQLSSHNTKRGVDMACIRGVEEALGPWRTIRQVENVFENAIDQAVV